MNKLDTFLGKHGSKIIIILLVLTYFKSCGIDSETNKVKKELVKVQAEVDTLSSSLNSRIVDEQRMIELIKTVPAWKTLRIEEISDKERISINALEEKED
ncbi:hypothetical protein OAC86_00925 [bacterium]|nr:hypothetical protein [bacterium]MDB9900086.1 hypothetical protein [bacterium]